MRGRNEGQPHGNRLTRIVNRTKKYSVVARTVGGQARWCETNSANKE